jgi:hypothetical protein
MDGAHADLYDDAAWLITLVYPFFATPSRRAFVLGF